MPSIDVPRAAFRVSEACSALAISRSKLYLELAAGRLRAVKCGRRTLIPATEIKAWLDGLPTRALNTQNPPSSATVATRATDRCRTCSNCSKCSDAKSAADAQL